MEDLNKLLKVYEDPDVFNSIKQKIEKELANIKKIVNNLSQLREEAAYIESRLVMSIDAACWQQISQLTGLGSTDIMERLKEEKP